MTSRQFNGIYRPLIKAAWLSHCDASGMVPNNKTAHDAWYRQTLHDLTQGSVTSTKGISDKMRRYLIDRLKGVSEQSPRIAISGWSESQIDRFHELARAAWRETCIDGNLTHFIPWIEGVLKRHRREIIDGKWFMPNRKLSFDKIMADLAITAGDEYWARRTAEQGEIRLRYQLRRYLLDLDYLTQSTHDWSYVRGIYKQSGQLPKDIDDCPAETLWKVLAMLDTHIRRLCKDLDVRPMELPTRAHAAVGHHHIIPEAATHLHVGRELEHISEPIHVDAQEALPF